MPAEYEHQIAPPEPETRMDHGGFLEHETLQGGAEDTPRPTPEHLKEFREGLSQLDPERRKRIDDRVNDFIDKNPDIADDTGENDK